MRYFDVLEWQGRYYVREYLPESTTVYADRLVHTFTDYQQASNYAIACDMAGKDLEVKE